MHVVGSLHPAFILRQNARLAGTVEHALARAMRAAFRDQTPQWTEDEFALKGITADSIVAGLRSMAGKRVAFDVETDGRHSKECSLRCVGFYDGTKGIIVPLLYRDGEREDVPVIDKKGDVKVENHAVWKPYFSGEALRKVLAAMRELLLGAPVETVEGVHADAAKAKLTKRKSEKLTKKAKKPTALVAKDAAGAVATGPQLFVHGPRTAALVYTQNGQYDRQVMRQALGLDIAAGATGFTLDTIVAHHVIASYLPHKLGFLAPLYTDAPYYKANEDGESWSAGTDLELWRYCLRGDTRVVLADGSTRAVAELVRTRSKVNLLATDEHGNIISSPIYDWHQNRKAGQTWRRIRTTATSKRGLVLTPDHKVFIKGRGKLEAQDVAVGDIMLLPEREFSLRQKSLIAGTLLGDSVLRVSPKWRKNPREATAASIDGGQMHAEYAAEKVRVLPGVLTAGKPRQTPHGAFYTFASLQFAQLRDWAQNYWDARGQRRITGDVLALLRRDPAGLAWWFADDGCRQKQDKARGRSDTICLNVQRYLREDQELVQRWLEQQFGRVWLDTAGVLRFSVSATKAFAARVGPFLHPEVRYKLPGSEELPYTLEPAEFSTQPVMVEVTANDAYVPKTATRSQRLMAETRFCVSTVAGNFFTTEGLVKNCLRDVKATWLIAEQMQLELKEVYPNAQLVFEQDTWQEDQCEKWKDVGIELDRSTLRYYRHHYMTVRDRALAAMRELLGEVGLNSDDENFKALLAKLMDKAAVDDIDDPDGSGATLEVFNPASLIELRMMLAGLKIPLTEVTATGQLSTAKEILTGARKGLLTQKVPPSDPRIAFLDYLFAWRESAKVVGTYLYPEILKDGRVHPNFNVHVVPTGRLSSSGPNFQNQPAEIRGMFVARIDHLIVSMDWDALEMRLGAFMSGDPVFIEVFRKYDAKTGPKPHIANMAAIFGLPATAEAADQNPGMYRAAKVFAYAVAYGAGEDTVFEQVREELPDMSWEAFQLAYANYKKTYPRLFQFQREVVQQGTRMGFIDSYVLGRRMWFFERTWGESSPEATAMQNAPYQSAGSDVVGAANRRIMDRLVIPMRRKLLKRGDKWKDKDGVVHVCFVDEVIEQLAQVHDELVFEVPKRLKEEFVAECKRIAEEKPEKLEVQKNGAVKRTLLDWNLPVDIKAKRRWKPVQARCGAKKDGKPCRELVDIEPVETAVATHEVWEGACKCGNTKRVEVPLAVSA